MIILDTHIWEWWVHGDAHLPDHYRTYLEVHEGQGLGVSAISCWEVAKLVQLKRLEVRGSVTEWVEQALGYPGIHLFYMTPRIAVESTRLPGTFHRDPADQIIVATARIRGCSLLTADERILQYPHVKILN